MDEEKRDNDTVRCDACQKEIPRRESRKMAMRVCCNVVHMPLCRECWDRFGKKMNIVREEQT